MSGFTLNYWHEPQSKLWKTTPQQVAGNSGYYTFLYGITPRHFIPGIISNSQRLLDNSAKKLQCALLLKFKPHYD